MRTTQPSVAQVSENRRLGLIAPAAVLGGLLFARAVYRRINQINLRGKTVLITGGSRGLGLALARAFAGHGARVAICARSPKELARARADLLRYGSDISAFVCDVTDEAQATQTVREVEAKFGYLDILVNCAGMIAVGPMQNMTVNDLRNVMAVNYWGAVYCCMAALPQMRARKFGRIVNIASIGGKVPTPHLIPYSTSKFALVGFSEGLRIECVADGISVTTVCPGLMRTGSPGNASFKGQNRKEFAWFSIGDSLPGISMDVQSAARQIVAACRRGDGEVILSMPAKLLAKGHAIFTNTSLDVLSLINWLLPSPGGIGQSTAKGFESESALSPSPMTVLTQKAEREYNQLD